MISSLKQLSTLIASSIDTLEQECATSNTPFPSLDDPFFPPSEAFRANPKAAEAANVIAAAANQLVAMVLPPSAAIFNIISGHFKSAALRVCLESNVTEILREGGPQGVHVKDIASRANISGEKIARLLRYLATHHVYKETEPDTFANTRISSLLDTGKSVKDILANPAGKDDNTHGFPALAGHHLDEVNKASSMLWENMSDPLTGHSVEISKAPLNRAFNFSGPIWSFFGDEQQVHRQRRFANAMKGVAALEPADSIVKAFDWASLSADAVVVDVGGGVGGASMTLAKTFPHLKITVQDLPPVIKEGEMYWKAEFPAAIESGRVTLLAHDFFTPQPIHNATVFLLKQIMHDWSDPYAIKILTKLREVARPDTKIILIDSLMPFACHDPSSDTEDSTPGAVPKEAPAPLLANYGIANEMGYNGDLTMLMMSNCQERTVKHLKEMLESTGWRLTRVVRDLSSSFLQPVIAVPL